MCGTFVCLIVKPAKETKTNNKAALHNYDLAVRRSALV
jgi:hypothetical protein